MASLPLGEEESLTKMAVQRRGRFWGWQNFWENQGGGWMGEGELESVISLEKVKAARNSKTRVGARTATQYGHQKGKVE